MKGASIALLALAAWTSLAAAAQALRAASWDEQNHAMIYLIMDLSSINAINGINLTRDQAVRLRNLAREIKAASPQDPLTWPGRCWPWAASSWRQAWRSRPSDRGMRERRGPVPLALGGALRLHDQPVDLFEKP